MMEGGLRAPALIRWPRRVRPGVSDGIVHAVDLFTTLARIGGAREPSDRPIDGLDQTAHFIGAAQKSPREGFPIYVEDKLFGAKFRDWKLHIFWQPDPAKPAERPAKPYLFNITTDPKEETPREEYGGGAMSEDNWVRPILRKIVEDMQASLERFPPVPFGAPLDFVPPPGAEGAPGKSTRTMEAAD